MFIKEIEKRVLAKNKKKIILPESDDIRVLKACEYLSNNNLVDIVLIGNDKNIKSICDDNNITLNNVEIIDNNNYDKTDLINELYKIRKDKGLTIEEAEELLNDNIYFSTMLVHSNYADGMVAGATHATADILRPALRIIKTKGNLLASSFMIMDLEKPLIFSDCSLNVNPSSDELVEIAVESSESFKKLINDEPRVAFLSYSTNGSAQSEFVDKVNIAAKKMKENYASIKSDGEMQFDSAVNGEIAKLKYPNSEVAGNANVLIFPDLNSANIGYKIAQQLGNITVYGPIIQGLNKPVNDLSRGATIEDIIGTVLITTLQ